MYLRHLNLLVNLGTFMSPTPARLLLIQGISSLRVTSEEEILEALPTELRGLRRQVQVLDTRENAEAVASGFWPPVDAQVRAFAAALHANLEEQGPAHLLYAGLDEVPTLIALGALFGDEHRIACQDYDRDSGRYVWPETRQTLELETVGSPSERLEAAGEVVIRVEISYPIQDAHIDAVLDRRSRLADVVIRPRVGPPRPGLIRSQADVEHFRSEFRDVLAALELQRPGTEDIHLFLAGPVSACLAAGQELRLRNGGHVQTYRHRSHDDPPLAPALRLTPEASSEVQAPLSDAEMAIAEQTRAAWRDAQTEVLAHADRLRELAGNLKWPQYLHPSLQRAECQLAGLATIWELSSPRDSIAPESVPDFYFDRTARSWHLPDRMLVAMNSAAGGDAATIRRLARAFLWHEYLHEHQYLTRYTAADVGSFPNCLERVDYIADVFGVLHQVDYRVRTQGDLPDSEIVDLIRAAMTEAIEAFWTFEPTSRPAFWQQRRLRRYLNWYWRREQLANTTDLGVAMKLLCQQPTIEIAAPALSTDRRRVYLDLSRTTHPDQVELALVDERYRLLRFSSGPNLSIPGLLTAFRDHDKAGIDEFFTALYEHARQRLESSGDIA